MGKSDKSDPLHDLANGQIAVAQQVASLFESQDGESIERGHAGRSPEHAGEVSFADVNRLGDQLSRQWLGQVLGHECFGAGDEFLARTITDCRCSGRFNRSQRETFVSDH